MPRWSCWLRRLYDPAARAADYPNRSKPPRLLWPSRAVALYSGPPSRFAASQDASPRRGTRLPRQAERPRLWAGYVSYWRTQKLIGGGPLSHKSKQERASWHDTALPSVQFRR